MQGSSPLLTVKQVATALGIDERSVRDKLTVGTLKGTKKTVGNKDQWFVHQRDLDAELARRGLAANYQQQRGFDNWAPAPQTSFQPGHTPVAPTAAYPRMQQASEGVGSTTPMYQEAPEVSTVTAAYAKPPEATSAPETQTESGAEVHIADVVEEVEGTPESDKSSSGGEPRAWLNEDMQKQLLATAEVFMKPLVDRIEALTAADKDKDALLKAKDEELEEVKKQLRMLPDFEAQKAKLLNEIEAQKTATEIQIAKAKEQAEAAQALADENERLKQKAEEAVLSAAKLAELEKVVLELQKPKPTFWQKLMGSK